MWKRLIIATIIYLAFVFVATIAMSIGNRVIENNLHLVHTDYWDIWFDWINVVFIIGVVGPIILCAGTLYYWRRRKHAEFTHPGLQKANRLVNIVYLALALVACAASFTKLISHVPWMQEAGNILIFEVLLRNSDNLLVFNIVALSLCRPVPGSHPSLDDFPESPWHRVPIRSRFRWTP